MGEIEKFNLLLKVNVNCWKFRVGKLFLIVVKFLFFYTQCPFFIHVVDKVYGNRSLINEIYSTIFMLCHGY